MQSGAGCLTSLSLSFLSHKLHTITINTSGRKSADDLIRSIEIDGKPMEGYTLSHDVFLKDSKITIRY